MFACELDQIVNTRTCRKNGRAVTIRMATDYIECLTSDRSGSAEHGNSFGCIHSCKLIDSKCKNTNKHEHKQIYLHTRTIREGIRG